MLGGAIGGRFQISTHRVEERVDQIRSDLRLQSGAREGMHHQVGAVAPLHRAAGLLGVVLQRLGLLSRVQAGGAGGAIDDLIGHPHQGVEAAHMAAVARSEQLRRQPERGRVGGDHTVRRSTGGLGEVLGRIDGCAHAGAPQPGRGARLF